MCVSDMCNMRSLPASVCRHCGSTGGMRRIMRKRISGQHLKWSMHCMIRETLLFRKLRWHFLSQCIMQKRANRCICTIRREPDFLHTSGQCLYRVTGSSGLSRQTGLFSLFTKTVHTRCIYEHYTKIITKTDEKGPLCHAVS